MSGTRRAGVNWPNDLKSRIADIETAYCGFSNQPLTCMDLHMTELERDIIREILNIGLARAADSFGGA